MNHLQPKYFKKAISSLGIGDLVKGIKSIEGLNAYIFRIRTAIDNFEGNLDVAKENLKIATNNIIVLNSDISTYNEMLDTDEYKYNRFKSSTIKDKINCLKYDIQDMEEVIDGAKKTIVENPKSIEVCKNVLDNYFSHVEPQMRIERTKELNKGKNYQYSYV